VVNEPRPLRVFCPDLAVILAGTVRAFFPAVSRTRKEPIVKNVKLAGLLAAFSIFGLVALAPSAAQARGGGFHGGGFHGGGGGFHGGGGGFRVGPSPHFGGSHFGGYGGYRGYVGPRFGGVPRQFGPAIGVHAWGPGYWGWRGGARIWIGGAYPASGWVWMAPHWQWNGATWFWQEGYWAPPSY
jgi:hypothetical protein